MLTRSSGTGLFHQVPVLRSNYYVPGEIVPMKDFLPVKNSYIKMKIHSDNPGNLIFAVCYSTKNWKRKMRWFRGFFFAGIKAYLRCFALKGEFYFMGHQIFP